MQYLMGLLLITLFTLLIFSKLKPSLIFGSVATFIWLTGVIDENQLLKSFSTQGLITLILVIFSALALEKTRLLKILSTFIFRGGANQTFFRMGISTILSSAVLNNTAVVSTLVGVLRKSRDISPSKLLLPLTFFATLGGTLTLIGTSTNLLLNSFLEEAQKPTLSFFSFLPLGILVCIGGFITLLFLSKKITFENEQQKLDGQGDFFLDVKVLDDSPLVGKSIRENGLRTLDALFLAEVSRKDQLISPAGPDLIINAGDSLIFTGDIKNLNQLKHFKGLSIADNQINHNEQNLVEVLLSPVSSMIDQSIKEAGFRSRFDAVVVAIRRHGRKLSGKIGEHKLRAGDKLILATGENFKSRIRSSQDFFLLNDVALPRVISPIKEWVTIGAFVLLITLVTLNILTLFKAMFIYVTMTLLLKVLKVSELRKSFPFEIWLIIGSALVISKGVETSGLNDVLLDVFKIIFQWLPHNYNWVAFYFMALGITQLITNNAAAALLAPFAIVYSESMNLSPVPFIMAIAFGASASFISPYGYQTNLIVQSAGNYSKNDFLKMGLPLTIVYTLIVLIFLPLIFTH